jgi:hypothetical protein
VKAIVYADNTLALPVEPFCRLLSSVCPTIEYAPGREQLRIESTHIRFPTSYDDLPKRLKAEASRYDIAFMCTNVPYENNFFFESAYREVLISFHGWNRLTDLPVSNGVAYFIASILCDEQAIGVAHSHNTGCVNDFWWDKRGVDLGMRAAFLCAECRAKSGNAMEIEDVIRLLDLVSVSSRVGRDILAQGARQATEFDVSLCHNSDDKPAVRLLARELKTAGVRTWFDEEQLRPGLPWQPEIERQIGMVGAACVFVGNSGFGPWQDVEARASNWYMIRLDTSGDVGAPIDTCRGPRRCGRQSKVLQTRSRPSSSNLGHWRIKYSSTSIPLIEGKKFLKSSFKRNRCSECSIALERILSPFR